MVASPSSGPRAWLLAFRLINTLDAAIQRGLESEDNPIFGEYRYESGRGFFHARVALEAMEFRFVHAGDSLKRVLMHPPEVLVEEYSLYHDQQWRDDVVRDFIELTRLALPRTRAGVAFWLQWAASIVAAEEGRPVRVDNVADLETFYRVQGSLEGHPFRIELEVSFVDRAARGASAQIRDRFAAEFRRILAAS